MNEPEGIRFIGQEIQQLARRINADSGNLLLTHGRRFVGCALSLRPTEGRSTEGNAQAVEPECQTPSLAFKIGGCMAGSKLENGRDTTQPLVRFPNQIHYRGADRRPRPSSEFGVVERVNGTPHDQGQANEVDEVERVARRDIEM